MPIELIYSLLSALFAAGGAYAAVKVELRWLRRDTDLNSEAILRAHKRIDGLQAGE